MSEVLKRGTVCIVGHHEFDYPRNRSIQAWMRDEGFELVLCHHRTRFPWRTLFLLASYLRVARRVHAVFVTEGGHPHVPYLKAATWLTRRPLIFDPFLSRYNTRVEDRRLYAPGSPQAYRAAWQDWAACHAADVLVFDTEAHRDYFFHRYGLDKPAWVIEIGVDEEVFRPAPTDTAAAPVVEVPARRSYDVLFYGTFIPLHGAEYIVDAAARLRDRQDIRFTMIGHGQTLSDVRARAERLRIPNLCFVDPMPTPELAARIQRADVCLGVFGETEKSKRVVPNKVVQCAAAAKAIITRSSEAINQYFVHGRSAFLVDPADGAAIAEAVVELWIDADLRARLGRGAREVFEQRFSSRAQRPKVRAMLEAALRR
jgi:glycosyltransferase involved in cell wall biosynthesis